MLKDREFVELSLELTILLKDYQGTHDIHRNKPSHKGKPPYFRS